MGPSYRDKVTAIDILLIGASLTGLVPWSLWRNRTLDVFWQFAPFSAETAWLFQNALYEVTSVARCLNVQDACMEAAQLLLEGWMPGESVRLM